jgi:hypothetical protein
VRRNHRGYRVGEGHHRAKVSDAVVRAMRARYVPFVFGLHRVAREFGVPVSTARDICGFVTRPL